MSECGGLETLNVVTSIVTAVATLLIAAVAQIYSTRQSRIQAIIDKREALREANNEINVEEAVMLILNKRVDVDGKMQYMNGSANWNNTWNPEREFVERVETQARLVLSSFIDGLRACALVFDEVNSGVYAGKVWSGKYDVKTKNIRRTAKAFRLFYTMTYDGIAENRREYLQKEVGSEKEWKSIVNMLAYFDPETSLSTLPWTYNPFPTAKVSIEDEEDKE